MDLTTDYFSLFEVQEQYALDLKQLKKAHRQLQRQYHPDKVGDDLNSIRLSGHINSAYECLISPTERAKYIAKRQGATLAEHNFADQPSYLMAQIELREELSELANDEQVHSFIAKRDATLEELGAQFTQLANATDWNNAAITVGKMQFAEKLKAEAKQKLYAN